MLCEDVKYTIGLGLNTQSTTTNRWSFLSIVWHFSRSGSGSTQHFVRCCVFFAVSRIYTGGSNITMNGNAADRGRGKVYLEASASDDMFQDRKLPEIAENMGCWRVTRRSLKFIHQASSLKINGGTVKSTSYVFFLWKVLSLWLSQRKKKTN